MTQAEELNLVLELIFDNSPTFWHSRIGTNPEKNLIFLPESGALLGQPIEQSMTTNTSKHSPTEYNVRCGVIISLKRYACTHFGRSRELVCPVIGCHLGAAAAAGILLTPPSPKNIDRRAAAAGQNHPARRRRNTDVGAGLYVEHRLISKVMSRMIRFSYTVVHQFFNIAFTDRNDSFINYYYVQSKDNRAWNQFINYFF